MVGIGLAEVGEVEVAVLVKDDVVRAFQRAPVTIVGNLFDLARR